MSLKYNHYYEIYNPDSGMYLNLYGNHEDNEVSNGDRVTMFARTNNPDQRWALERYGGDYKVRIVLQRGEGWYALNYNTNNAGCIVWHLDFAADSDTVITLESVVSFGGLYRLKLPVYNAYLTVVGSDLKWLPNTGSGNQIFQFVEPGSNPSSGESGSSGGGTGPYGNYVYPTVCRKLYTEYSYNHPAIDIRDLASDHGIYAFADGVVSFVQDNNNPYPGTDMWTMGNCVAINHNNPITTKSGKYARTIYMHMQDTPSLVPGEHVVKGQRIGTIGTTGKSTGNHLHFSVSTGDASTLAPGYCGWIGIKSLPDFDATSILPEYYLDQSPA